MTCGIRFIVGLDLTDPEGRNALDKTRTDSLRKSHRLIG